MDHTSIHMRVDIFENTHRPCDWQIASTSASRGPIVNCFESLRSVPLAPHIGPIATRAICYMNHTSIHKRVDIFENTQSSCDWQTTLTTVSRGLIVI